jgi:ubiquinone/menaquinone biosynthesis C-methylase UbiE
MMTLSDLLRKKNYDEFSLDELARSNKTDKATACQHLSPKNYTLIYENYFKKLRQDPITLLEIGIESGASLKTWYQYFPNGKIIGIDINKKCSQFKNDRINIEIGSQNDEAFLQQLINKYVEFDIIIDDGSHVWKDQIKSFEILFPVLKKNGFYFVEDLHTSYDSSGRYGDLGSEINFVHWFKEMTDLIVKGQYYSISFYKSLCLIQK